MKTKNLTAFLVLALLFILACSLGQSAPAVGATQAAPSPFADSPLPPTVAVEAPTSAPVAPVGISISASGTSFVVPQGLAGGAMLAVVPASLSPDAPYWDVYPAYNEFSLGGYVLQDTFHSPRIIVYPLNEYAKANEGAGKIIAKLQALLANPSAPLPERLPFLPLFNAGQLFHAHEQFIKFQNGTGVRFLTQFGQAPFPANNRDLIYTFQGITSDGAYYVAALLPVNVGFLPQNSNPETPLPADGVPFDWNNFENTQAHFDLVRQKLNAADPNAFTPSLTTLDAMLQSVAAGIQ